jgi:predicted O-methyltransferase YrrM
MLVVQTAQQALSLFDDESIGLLHIDGNHSADVARRDVETWLPKVKPGGVIVLDDTDWPTVQAARALLTERCKKIIHGTTWEAFRK